MLCTKATMIFICLLFLLKFASCGEMDYIPKEYVNPNDMRYYDRSTKTMKYSNTAHQRNEEHSVCDHVKHEGSDLRDENERFEIFVERFINRLLQSANLKDQNMKSGTKIVTEIPVSITAEELDRLNALGHKFKSADLNKLDDLLSLVLTNERGFTFDSLVDFLNPVQELFFNMSVEKIIIMMGITVSGVTLWMFAIGKSFKRIMMFLYLLCFLGGLAFNAWNMYMEAVSEQIAESKKYMQIPDVCDPKKSSWWSFIFSMRDECKEFHRTMHVNPLSRVIPSIVFSHTLSMMFIHPLKDLGARCGDFLYGVSNAAPWPVNIIFLPFVLVVSCIVFVFIVIIQLGASLNCWTLLGGLSIGAAKQKNEDNTQAALLSEIQSLKKTIEVNKIVYQPEAGDSKLNVAYRRSQSIATCSIRDDVRSQGENIPIMEQNTSDTLISAIPPFKIKKSFFGRTLSQKSLIAKKKYKVMSRIHFAGVHP